MILALVAAVLAGALGWRRAARRGGNRADQVQYALSHAIPAFLVVLVALAIAGRMGWLG